MNRTKAEMDEIATMVEKMDREGSHEKIRKIGDQGVPVPLFNGLRVLIETDHNGVTSKGTATRVWGKIYAAYINVEEATGLICANIYPGQMFYGEMINSTFALMCEPHQVVTLVGETAIEAMSLLTSGSG